MSDIKKINGKFYDFKCRNQSFTETAAELKYLGIKNYYFMLEIKNPNVADIDPWKRNITPHEIKLLMQELKQNMWFYARTVARVRTSKGVVPFYLHRGLAAALWCFINNYDACLCEPRQTYKTTGLIASAISWAFQIGSNNSKIKFFGPDEPRTKVNLAHLKDDIRLLPEWLQFLKFNSGDGKVIKAKQITEILQNGLFHNEVTITAKPVSESAAMNIARGDSAEIMYFDEIEHTLHFPIVMENSAPAFKVTSDNAKEVGNPSSRLMTTTPGNLDTREGREAMPVIKSMIPFTEKIYDMDHEALENYRRNFREQYHGDGTIPMDREILSVFYIEYHYHQVRKSHQWVQEQYNLIGNKMTVRREVLLQRLRGSKSSPIDPEDLDYLLEHMKRANGDILLTNRQWRMITYEHGITRNPMMVGPTTINPFDETIPYIVAIDPAGGGGGDNTAISVINPYNLLTAAEFRSPYIPGTELLRLLIDLVSTYIPRAVLFPEKNSMGIYLIHSICESSIRENLYWSKSTKELEELSIDRPDAKLIHLSQQYKKYGVYTSKPKREAMFEILFTHLHEHRNLLTSEYVVDDICKLIKTSTGKIEASQGEHDDSIMAYLLANYLYYTGDNLDFFGIDKTKFPIFGTVEPDKKPMENYQGIFSTENVTFETIQRNSIIQLEEYRKEAVRVNPRFYDDVYSRQTINPNEDVNISSFFFDQMNI